MNYKHKYSHWHHWESRFSGHLGTLKISIFLNFQKFVSWGTFFLNATCRIPIIIKSQTHSIANTSIWWIRLKLTYHSIIMVAVNPGRMNLIFLLFILKILIKFPNNILNYHSKFNREKMLFYTPDNIRNALTRHDI